jgi:hypothetical protein
LPSGNFLRVFLSLETGRLLVLFPEPSALGQVSISLSFLRVYPYSLRESLSFRITTQPISPPPAHAFIFWPGFPPASEDYREIHPLFGTMDDFADLLNQVHARDMKLILDLVPNHTSNEHPWFLESRASRDNPKRDWYLWQDLSPDGSEPNNWLSVFGGSGWEWDEKTQQYYYHAFLKEQPDLNWRNPEVQQAMLEVMRFWLDKGVDGFRVDVMWHMIKDQQLRDNPKNPDYEPHQPTYNQLLSSYSTDQPEVHHLVRMMREVMDQYEERVMIGEIYLPIHRWSPITESITRVRTFRSTFNCWSFPGTPGKLPRLSTNMREPCLLMAGPTGCWATTTKPASQAG